MVGKYLLLLLFYMKILPNFALPSAYDVKIVQLMPMCIKWMYVILVVLSALVSFQLFSAMVQCSAWGGQRGGILYICFSIDSIAIVLTSKTWSENQGRKFSSVSVHFYWKNHGSRLAYLDLNKTICAVISCFLIV